MVEGIWASWLPKNFNPHVSLNFDRNDRSRRQWAHRPLTKPPHKVSPDPSPVIWWLGREIQRNPQKEVVGAQERGIL